MMTCSLLHPLRSWIIYLFVLAFLFQPAVALSVKSKPTNVKKKASGASKRRKGSPTDDTLDQQDTTQLFTGKQVLFAWVDCSLLTLSDLNTLSHCLSPPRLKISAREPCTVLVLSADWGFSESLTFRTTEFWDERGLFDEPKY